MLDGEVFEGGQEEDREVNLGEGQFVEDFEKGLQGVTVGEEKRFDVTFPDEFPNKDLAGKTTQFEVKVKKVQEAELPELNEDFIKKFGIEEGTEEKFREQLQEHMQNELDNTLKTKERSQIFEQLEKLHDFELPETLIKQEAEQLHKQKQENQAEQDFDFDAISAEERNQAERRVKTGLIINQMVKEYAIEVDEDKVKERVQDALKQYGGDEQMMQYFYQNEEIMQSMRSMVLEDQVMDKALELANIAEKQASYDDVMQGKV
jgi:trigger factor